MGSTRLSLVVIALLSLTTTVPAFSRTTATDHAVLAKVGAAVLAELPAGSADYSYVEALLAEARSRHPGRGRCDDYYPLRSPFFGDLHVHTSFSMDSIYFGTGLDNDPAVAYRFAQGEPIGLAPFDPAGNPMRIAQLRRPLDFAAVTDHAEYFGEVRICYDTGHPGYGSAECAVLREELPFNAFFVWFSPMFLPIPPGPSRFDFCGPGELDCLEVASTVWEETRQAAEEALDRSRACGFTSFVGYEWTATTGGANLHRNVLFRNDVVPELPISYTDAPLAEQLWDSLDDDCLEAGTGCDALVVPHNSNFSLGRMFLPESSDGSPLAAADAARRAAMEPLVEIVQHKGTSECRPGLGTTDEMCDFNLSRNSSLVLPPGTPQPPFSALSFIRNGLKEGLAQQQELGVNPFQFGFVGGTDTHNSTSGNVDEDQYAGHLGVIEASLPGRLALDGNPGGLTVIWARENSREALFAAMRRREVYATSGPRLTVRMFGGFHYPRNLCDSPAFNPLGYALGKPMGGELDVPAAIARRRSPRIAVSALRDPGVPESPGTQLQRIQVVKGWVEDGESQEAVYDVAGDPDNGAGVDPETGDPVGPGFDSLCTVWEDPDFDPDQPAFYYARVLENPSWRWTKRQCHAAGVDCSEPDNVPPGFEACCDEDLEFIIQERAWTSPIWYTPRVTGGGGHAPSGGP